MKILFLIIFCMYFFAATVYANNELIPVDAVLVLDVSLSMRTADPYRISNDAMNLFIEKLTESRDRVGIVSYAGQVEFSSGLHEIDAEEREFLRDIINGLGRASWTDHGLGLLEAVRMLEHYNEGNRQGVIIFLTDGNMNVNPWDERTNEIAQLDVYEAIYAALEMNIPIHTIGLNFDGSLDVEYVNRIAEFTGGLSFETANAADIPEIISAFFYAMISAPTLEIEKTYEAYEVKSVEIILEEAALENEVQNVHINLREESESCCIIHHISFVYVLIVIFILLIAAVFIKKIAGVFAKRVFTGKLEIEKIDVDTQISKNFTINLIEHGKYATLNGLLKSKTEPAFNSVIFTPSPTAPSHLPQLLIKCKNKNIKFIKNFMEQNVSKGIEMASGSEIIIETEREHLIIRYELISIQ